MTRTPPEDSQATFLLTPSTSTPRRRRESFSGVAPGDQLAGRFRIVRLLGSGGMGEVFEAEDMELHDVIAVKIVRPEMLDSEDSAGRLRREVQLARKITHPNVCRTFDLFRLGIVHRDLKPSNIMLVEEPEGVRAVITDFGLARSHHHGSDQPITLTDEAMGSPP